MPKKTHEQHELFIHIGIWRSAVIGKQSYWANWMLVNRERFSIFLPLGRIATEQASWFQSETGLTKPEYLFIRPTAIGACSIKL